MKKSSGGKYLSRRYLSSRRWMSFWHQINEVMETGADNVLEIGTGGGVVTQILRALGVSVTTFDIDPETAPDVVGDVLELRRHFQPASFDCVLCAQVLEHLPFESFEPALVEIHRVTRRNVVLSLPYRRRYWGVIARFHLPLGAGRLNIRIPRPVRHVPGDHKWEVGTSGYPVRRIEKVLRRHFRVERRFYPFENLYHLFFRLRRIDRAVDPRGRGE